MGWYTHVYTFIRNVKKTNPILGHILSISLNFTLVIQLFFILLSVYVYGQHIAGHFLRSSIQIALYMMIYLSLVFMAVWCLLMTVLTPVARVPITYRISNEQTKQLKAIATQIGKKHPRESSSEEKQAVMLELLAKERNLKMIEGNRYGGYKYCYDCQHLKPDRSKHCRSCGFCVLRYDHHCPYINKCINHNNYKSFCLYILYSSLSIFWFFLSSSECVLRFIINSDWEKDKTSIIWIISALIPISLIGFTVYADLLFYHYYLLSNNSTTADEVGTCYMRLDSSASYNLGYEENFRQVFGWGLWFFPLWTSLEDGLHFEIKNSPSSKYSIKRVICENEKMVH